ncbi:MAG: UPF0716 protein FxsA [Halioglobus sp.]|jgi:UPF0716 protein FxsA
MRLMLLALPWLELFTLIQLGVETSALTAVFYVLVTFSLGVTVIRRQGMGMFQQLRETQEGKIIGPALFRDHMAVGLAGLLLIFPGMISDFVALFVMIGPVRRTVIRWWGGDAPQPYSPDSPSAKGDVIEGEFTRVDKPD